MKLCLLVIFCVYIFPLVAGAQAAAANLTPEEKLLGTPAYTPIVKQENYYPTWIRLGFLAETSLQQGSKSGVSGSGSVLVDFGKSWYGFETGLTYLGTQSALSLADSDPTVGNHSVNVISQYVGVPLLFTLNYVEHPQASFLLKLGVMPAYTLAPTTISYNDSAGATYTMHSSDFFAVIGMTGSAPLSDHWAFVLDISYYRGLTKLDPSGSYNACIATGIGFRYSL
jgi:hypothetical protein